MDVTENDIVQQFFTKALEGLPYPYSQPPGDAEAETETLLLRAFGEGMVQADVLKLGHHGSNDATGGPFLDAVNPQAALVSLGRDNEYGHPHEAVAARLKERGIPLYRTDQHGVITVFLDGKTVTIVP